MQPERKSDSKSRAGEAESLNGDSFRSDQSEEVVRTFSMTVHLDFNCNMPKIDRKACIASEVNRYFELAEKRGLDLEIGEIEDGIDVHRNSYVHKTELKVKASAQQLESFTGAESLNHWYVADTHSTLSPCARALANGAFAVVSGLGSAAVFSSAYGSLQTASAFMDRTVALGAVGIAGIGLGVAASCFMNFMKAWK